MLIAALIAVSALMGTFDAGLASPDDNLANRAIPIMASFEDGLWLQCSIDAPADLTERLAGFCAHLAAEITRLTGRPVQLGAHVLVGAMVLGVMVAPINSSRATVVLTSAIQGESGVQLIETQELRLGRKDGRLSASSAAALMNPLMIMLDNARGAVDKGAAKM